jgi:hypothetical protein
LDDPSGDQVGLFTELDSLGAAAGTEFVEESAGMSLDRILADEEAVSDFPVAESGGDQPEDLKFAGGDAQFGETHLVEGEWDAEWRLREWRLPSREGESEPYA